MPAQTHTTVIAGRQSPAPETLTWHPGTLSDDGLTEEPQLDLNGIVVPIRRLSTAQVAAWRRLAGEALAPNPGFEPQCVIPASRYLPRGGEMLLVAAEEDGRFFGCFPVVRKGSQERMSVSWPGMRRPALSTQVRRPSYDCTPLLSRERSAEAATTLLGALHAYREWPKAGSFGLLVLDALDDGPVCTLLTSAAEQLGMPVHTYGSWRRPIVRRQSDPAAYGRAQSHKSHRELARKRRRLEDKLGAPLYVVDRSSDPRALDELVELEASGYKGTEGFALARQPGYAEWFKEMCSDFRSSGRFVLYSLEGGGTTVAMTAMLKGGEGYFGLLTAYDEDFSAYSPGTQLHVGAIGRFHDNTDAQWVDTCGAAGTQYLLNLYPDRRDVSTVIVAIGGTFDRACLACYVALRRVFGRDSLLRKDPRLSKALHVASRTLFGK
ncbi:MAG TPA: GNAT family N-acetyltransferase [Acidimicrobiales bacterium]|nr:GNAT family N-acetyltransferase [Acidimicrobiales bacterium]